MQTSKTISLQDQLDFIVLGSQTLRFHTMPMIKHPTVGHHSFLVACLVLWLRPDASAALLRAALWHDLAEHMTGDIPAPVKRQVPEFKVILDTIENSMLKGAACYQELDIEDYRVLKLADNAEGALACIQDKVLGNTGIAPAYANFLSYYDKIMNKDDEREFMLRAAIMKGWEYARRANDRQVGGEHYKQEGVTQPWDYIMDHRMNYLQGNVIKYVTRYRDKNGFEDLEKAKHYLEKLIEVEEAALVRGDQHRPPSPAPAE